jgi:hypothetical protein
VPFIRYTRDKRGYESTVVMHAYRGGQGPPRTRVLYLFRSPSNIKVGRHGLDPEVMEALEHTHPDLTFDWTGLLREPVPRVEVRERSERWRGRPEPPSRPAPEAPPPPIIMDDESPLGRTLGAPEAARLRARYNELLQRIARRSRTPEERDRLTERAVRLNPDDWQDAEAIRAALPAAQAEWEAILGELPQRRRGRRGGRSRPDDSGNHFRRASPAETAPASGGPLSAIIEDEGHHNEGPEEVFDARVAGADPDAGDSGDRHGLGADAGPATDPAPAPDSPGRDAPGPGVGDRHHD